MTFSTDELTEAARQIDSILHKLTETVKTLASKEDPGRYKSQITLASNRIRALTIARELIARELGRK